MHELRGSEKEKENQDGTPEDNGYLGKNPTGTLKQLSQNWILILDAFFSYSGGIAQLGKGEENERRRSNAC